MEYSIITVIYLLVEGKQEYTIVIFKIFYLEQGSDTICVVLLSRKFDNISIIIDVF